MASGSFLQERINKTKHKLSVSILARNPSSGLSGRERGGGSWYLGQNFQNFQNLTLFWSISLVKSHFRGPKIAIFSRLRRAQQGKMIFLVAPQAKILGIYLVKSTKPLKYCVFSVFALRITKKRSQSRISQILRIWVSGTRGGGFLLELGLI